MEHPLHPGVEACMHDVFAPTRLSLLAALAAALLSPPDAAANNGELPPPVVEIKIIQVLGTMPPEAILRTILSERSRLESTLGVLHRRPSVVSARIVIMPNGRGHPISTTVRPSKANTPVAGMMQLLIFGTFAPMRFPATSAGITIVDLELAVTAR
jgi:hypothetical protein